MKGKQSQQPSLILWGFEQTNNRENVARRMQLGGTPVILRVWACGSLSVCVCVFGARVVCVCWRAWCCAYVCVVRVRCLCVVVRVCECVRAHLSVFVLCVWCVLRCVRVRACVRTVLCVRV